MKLNRKSQKVWDHQEISTKKKLKWQKKGKYAKDKTYKMTQTK